MVAALRGFALVPLLAPTSVAIAILTRELPGLSWVHLLPFGLLAATVLLLIGWRLDNHRLQRLREAGAAQPSAASTGQPGMRRLVLASLLGILAIALLATFSWLSATQAAMLLVPLAVIVTLLGWGERPAAVYGEVRDTLAGMRNETFIFANSAVLAGLVAALVPVQAIAGHLGVTPLLSFFLGLLGMLAIIGLALLGVAPIVSLSLCTALLAQLGGHGMPTMQPAVALLTGFSLAMLLSPYGPSALMLARHAGLSPWRIAFGWNGRFVLLALGPLMLVPLLA